MQRRLKAVIIPEFRKQQVWSQDRHERICRRNATLVQQVIT